MRAIADCGSGSRIRAERFGPFISIRPPKEAISGGRAARAHRRPEWKGRLKLFEAYFVEGAEYRRAIGIVGVAEGTFDYWYQEVKRALGAEFSRTGLFPPARYFKHS
jgi:hypothetical protein